VKITSEATILSLYMFSILSIQMAAANLKGRSATYALRSWVTIPLTGRHAVA